MLYEYKRNIVKIPSKLQKYRKWRHLTTGKHWQEMEILELDTLKAVLEAYRIFNLWTNLHKIQMSFWPTWPWRLRSETRLERWKIQDGRKSTTRFDFVMASQTRLLLHKLSILIHNILIFQSKFLFY